MCSIDLMHLCVEIESGVFGVCSHIVRQEVCQCDGVGAGGGDQRDTRTVGNDTNPDASGFMVCSACIRVGQLGHGGGNFTLQTDY